MTTREFLVLSAVALGSGVLIYGALWILFRAIDACDNSEWRE